MKCTALVYDGGIRSFSCGKPAKWMVNGNPCCGIHARKNNVFVLNHGRVPIKKQGAGT